MTTTPPPETPVAGETLEEIAAKIAKRHDVYFVHTVPESSGLYKEIFSALRNEREAERDRITAAMMNMYWHFDCASERDTVLAIPHLPSCACLAKDNQEATEYQRHHNSCPVYIRVTAIREGK